MSHYFQCLKHEVLDRSTTSNWELALREWQPVRIWEEEDGCCTCGYNPILHHTEIYNDLTGHYLVVGRICVRNFLDMPAVESIFSAYDRLKANPKGSVPKRLIEYGAAAKAISEWDHRFLLSNYGRRNLTTKQLWFRERAARRILRHLTSNAFQNRSLYPKEREALRQLLRASN